MARVTLPDLPSLRLLVDVARLGSIGAAGRAAGMSQQAASERLRTVEVNVGVTVLRRSPGGSTLTDAGVLLVEWATRLLDVADEIEQGIGTLRADRDRELSVVASMTVAEYLLPAWLVRLRQRHTTTVTLRATNSENVIQTVRAAEADLGFVEDSVSHSGLASLVVAHDELVVVAHPDDPWCRRRRGVAASTLARRGLTAREPGSGTRRVLESALRAAALTPSEPAVELTTTAAVRSSVLAGSPPAVLSRLAVEADLSSGRLRSVPVADLDLRRDLTAVWVGTARPPAGPVRDLLAIARTG